MHRLWLIFAQAVTVSLAVLFVLLTLKPEWLGERSGPTAVTIQQALPPSVAGSQGAPASYADAAQRALPSVVHIFTSKERSEEHTSELQSHHDLVCRLLLEKK